MSKNNDVGSHYRYVYTHRLTAAEKRSGEALINMDPYRICDLYNINGGPHEHLVKKGLRGTSKGHSKRKLIAELRACLDRWEQMLDEDGVE